MKQYGVKELSQLSGITVRTLHHYDKIGLLKPQNRTEAGYRYYGEMEFLRLQQILFYRELDFSLKEIQEILDDPAFDLLEALESHRSALRMRQKRISTLLHTIDHTIIHVKQRTMMTNPEELYKGLPKEMGTTYRDAAIEEYGDEVEHAEQELLKLGKEGFEQLKRDFDQVTRDLFALRNEAPDSEAVQTLIATHYKLIRAFWGTSNAENSQAEAYAGLGKLYEADERFTKVDGEAQPEFSSFLSQAMKHFTETQLGGSDV
ncbi:MAG: MerR family transcriptional regulator [Bacteroidota bacterium]